MKTLNNILITSAGRRVSLVKNFQATVQQFNIASKVYVTDMRPELSAAAHIADGHFKVKRVTDTDYLEELLALCIEQSISIVIPTIDTELEILARAKENFLEHNIFLAVSSPEFCQTFYLKHSTQEFFDANGFQTPKIVQVTKEQHYPLFAKLNNSSCSVGAEKVLTFERALELREKDDNYVFQEFIDGEEFTVDVFVDRNGEVLAIVPRKRLEVRAGEVSKAQAMKHPLIIETIKRLFASIEGAYGTITVQLFLRGSEVIFIEINPRFGGGYPLSWLSGADYAALLIKDYLGESQSYGDSWKDNLIMLRYDAEVLVYG